MASKLVVLSALALIVVAICEAASIPNGHNPIEALTDRSNDEHNLVQGKLTIMKDKLLYYKLIEIKPGAKGKKVTYTIDYNNEEKKITYLAVINLLPPSDGGYPVLNKGGVGEKSLKVTITSQKNKGLKYLAGVFGR